jgi:uncharacterized protein YcbK (DUF882 family)
VASRPLRLLVLPGLACAFLLGACAMLGPGPRARYDRWHRAHAAEVADYGRFLQANGVDGVVPMPQLLHTARNWRRCGDEFAVPPRESWPAMVPTLRLLAELRRDGILTGATRVASAWRSPEMNACAGGAASSRHLKNGAIDLDWDAPADGLGRLCAAWGGDAGERHAWGLGFYTRERIHLDTGGWRTWGHDHHSGTSFCVAGPG